MLQFCIKIIAIIISILSGTELEAKGVEIGQLYYQEQQLEQVDLISTVKAVHLNKNESI